MTSEWYEDGDLVIDFRGCRVWLRGQEVRLSALRFKILSCLIENSGRPVTAIEILRYAWEDIHYDQGLVRWHIAKLRKEIGDNPPRRIVHVRGFGYRYDPVYDSITPFESASSKPSRFYYMSSDHYSSFRQARRSTESSPAQDTVHSSRCYQKFR